MGTLQILDAYFARLSLRAYAASSAQAGPSTLPVRSYATAVNLLATLKPHKGATHKVNERGFRRHRCLDKLTGPLCI